MVSSRLRLPADAISCCCFGRSGIGIGRGGRAEATAGTPELAGPGATITPAAYVIVGSWSPLIFSRRLTLRIAELYRFLIALSVRPGISLTIFDQRVP